MGGLLDDIVRWFRGGARTAPVAPPTLRPYVDRDDDWCRCHPGKLEQVTAYLFPLKAGKSELTALCDTHFNNPSNQQVDVKPLLKGVVIGMFDYQRAFSTRDPDWGYLGYREAAVFVPVRLTVKGSEIDRIAAAVPYLFVSRFPPIVTGRESFGFPKRAAEMTFSPNSCCVRADVLRARRGAIDNDVVINIVSQVPEVPEEPILFPQEMDVASRMQRISAILVEQLDETVELSPFDEAPVVLLKQFRDASNPTLACHQSITLTKLELDDVPWGVTLMGGFDCDTPDYFSTRIATTLGLAQTKNRIVAGVKMELNFSLQSGETLWP